jgi:hypothetical protein
MAMILNVFPERIDSLARIKTLGNFLSMVFGGDFVKLKKTTPTELPHIRTQHDLAVF